MKVNGKQTLVFARMRKKDREGDLGRAKRHQEILRAIIRKGAKMASIVNLSDVLQALGENVKTDIRPIDGLALARQYNRFQHRNILSQTLKGTPFKKGGIFYYQVSPEEAKRARNTILDFMEK
jgi:anionic cell wall polymer biosynthesis LytR-Cps2A-Psr (LCP) family protein